MRMKKMAATLFFSVSAGIVSCDSTTLIDEPCTFTATDLKINVINSAEKPNRSLSTICLPRDLPRDDNGNVDCSVRASFRTEEATRRNCSEVFKGEAATDEYGVVYCALEQLSSETPRTGFYFDSDSTDLAENCPRSPARLGFEPENLLYVLEEFTVEVHCESRPSNSSCSVPVQTADAARNLGAPCAPSPIDGDEFDIAETSLEPDPQRCGSGMCMAFHLEGSIAPDCDPLTQTCVDEMFLRDRAVCTCRCSADEPGDAELCTCPDDYTCAPMLRSGAAAGGYCVKSSITTPR